MKVDPDRSFHPASRKEWRAWLKANHRSADVVWLIFDKQPHRNVTYAEAVEEALCFGWIDGVVKPLDAKQYAQRFTPRRNTSNWSAVNRERFARMEAKRLMTKAGREVGPQHAKPLVARWRDGDPLPECMRSVPPRKLAALTRSQREQFVRWVSEAKQEETRRKRLRELLARL